MRGFDESESVRCDGAVTAAFELGGECFREISHLWINSTFLRRECQTHAEIKRKI